MIHPNLIEKNFSEEVAGLLQHADIAISRAGAGSLSELALCGTPSILVPFPQATDQHQEANATYAAAMGGAIIVHQHLPEENPLGETLVQLLHIRLSGGDCSKDPLIQMRKQMKKLGVIDAEKKIVEILESLI